MERCVSYIFQLIYGNHRNCSLFHSFIPGHERQGRLRHPNHGSCPNCEHLKLDRHLPLCITIKMLLPKINPPRWSIHIACKSRTYCGFHLDPIQRRNFDFYCSACRNVSGQHWWNHFYTHQWDLHGQEFWPSSTFPLHLGSDSCTNHTIHGRQCWKRRNVQFLCMFHILR